MRGKKAGGGARIILTVLPALLIGPAVDTVNATDVIWDFFKKY
jgi:hypothetical protein